MLGLSCGIDYGLFILLRHRNNLLNGMSIEQFRRNGIGTAAARCVRRAKSSSPSAACPGGIPFLTVMGITAAAAVAVALLMRTYPVPAMLGFAAPR